MNYLSFMVCFVFAYIHIAYDTTFAYLPFVFAPIFIQVILDIHFYFAYLCIYCCLFPLTFAPFLATYTISTWISLCFYCRLFVTLFAHIWTYFPTTLTLICSYLSLILLLLFCSFGCSSSSFLFLFYSPTHSLLSPETYSWPLFRGDQVSISLFSIARFLNCVFCLIFFIIVAQTRTLH